jgi:spermidine/putrescine-binding protein
MIKTMTRWLPAIVLLAAVSSWAARPEGSETAGGRHELVFLTWSEYMEPEVVAAFEQKFNAKIKFVYFDADDTRDDMLVETDGRGYDLVLVNGIQMSP